MSNHFIPSSELIINPDGSIYHLRLKPGEIAPTILTVGDPDRVENVAQYFEQIEFTRQQREFKTSTGTYKGTRLTVISTGIGTDNVDIVLNELDALFQFDFETRQKKPTHTPLNIIRIGTSGAVQESIALDSFIASEHALAFDGLLPFYANHPFETPNNWPNELAQICPLITTASRDLINKVPEKFALGITATMPGFYAPQGRSFRLPSVFNTQLDALKNLDINHKKVTNLEMETAGIYGLSQLLGHQAISFNAILANRTTGEFSQNPAKTIDALIQEVLNWVITEV